MVVKTVNGKSQLYQGIRQTSRRVLDWVYPPAALRATDRGSDWSNITFLDDPCCISCGFPFEYDVGLETQCGQCIARPPDFDQMRAGFQYNDHSRGLVLTFKHGGYRDNLTMFSAHMRRAGRTFWPHTDIILPVPLHPTRLIQRRFNQAAILARRLAKDTGVPYRADILLRHKNTDSQGEQTAQGRFRNVRGAFSVSDNARDMLPGRTIVLVDDVFTTGATLNACARTLRKAGVKNIYGVCLARVVRGRPLPT